MKTFVLLFLFLFITVHGNRNRRIKKVFPTIEVLDSIPPSDQPIIAQIDFDLKSISFSEKTQAYILDKAQKSYSDIKEKKEAGETLSDYDNSLYGEGDSLQSIDRIYKRQCAWYLSGRLFKVFANKPYFSDTIRTRESQIHSLCEQRLGRCTKAVAKIINKKAASRFTASARKREYDDIYYFPVSLFLAKNGEEYCWIYVEAWEYVGCAGPSSVRVVQFTGGDGNQSEVKEPEEPIEKFTFGHIQGTVFSFDFTEELGTFRCL